MNCCNWEWLKYSTVLLFPHDFTRVDHQEENSIIITLRDKYHTIQPLYRDLFDTCLSWDDLCGSRESCASLRDVTLGMPFGCWLLGAVWRSKFFSRSFRLSRVSSEIWLSVGSMFKLGQMLKAESSSGAAPSFKKRVIFKQSSRESERERGGRFLDGLTSGRPPALFQWNGSCGRSPAHMDQSSVRKFICLVILSHEENILRKVRKVNFHLHQLVAFIMAVKMKPNSAYFLHVNSFPAKTHKRVQIKD